MEANRLDWLLVNRVPKRRSKKGTSAERGRPRIRSSKTIPSVRAFSVNGLERKATERELQGWFCGKQIQSQAVFKLYIEKIL